MSNNDLPPGWSMPDDMAESLSKVINRKANTTPLDDLIDALGQTANEIADIEPEPSDWTGWITYLLEVLQAEARKDRKDAAYESMLLDLREALETRIEGGKW